MDTDNHARFLGCHVAYRESHAALKRLSIYLGSYFIDFVAQVHVFYKAFIGFWGISTGSSMTLVVV